MSAAYFVYWIQSGQRTYIGATVDPKKRLRQHNGELVGGAARTRNRGPWHFEAVVSGFRTWREALQYEWAAKYYTRGCRGMASRRTALEALNLRERWTSNSPPAQDVPLTVEYSPAQYGSPPVEYPVQTTAARPQRRRSRTSDKPNPRRAENKTRRFKKTLHKVNY